LPAAIPLARAHSDQLAGPGRCEARAVRARLSRQGRERRGRLRRQQRDPGADLHRGGGAEADRISSLSFLSLAMRILLCGSVAYDNIMVFQGRFKDHILPEEIHILNVAFLVPEMRREFGGCAGNIAYNLKMLGGEPVIMATVGADSLPYMERLERL